MNRIRTSMRFSYRSKCGGFMLLVLQIVSNKELSVQGCKNMAFLPHKSGSYLRYHTIQTLTTPSQSMCRITCYLNEWCISYNFHQSTGTCDINDSDKFQHPEDFILKPGYVYVGTQNGCMNKPCHNNSMCRANFTYTDGFSCLCSSGYTGSECSEDIDECTSGAHNCSAYSRCQNTQGSFRCLQLAALGSREHPAKSCLDILVNGFSNGSGVYVLDLSDAGNPIEVYCDMTTDGGGWTKLKRLYLETPPFPENDDYNTYRILGQHSNNKRNVIPRSKAVMDIYQRMGFHQIHFYCYKKSVGRVLSIMTKNNTAGHHVVSFFTSQKEPVSNFPTACGSFDRLPEDTSILAQNCSLWGKGQYSNIWVNKWGSYYYGKGYRFATYPFGIEGTDRHLFSYRGDSSSKIRYLCDDDDLPVNVNDTWQISVR